MNMIYKDNKLFVELLGDISERKVNMMKERLFNLLSSYTINDIVIDVNDIFGLKKDLFNDFLIEFHSKFKANVTFINK